MPFPLVQLTKFEVGETFGINASVDEDDTYCQSDEVFTEVHDLYENPIGNSCVDVMVMGPASPNLVDNIYPNLLYTFYVLSSCSLPSPSPKYRNISLVHYQGMLEGNIIDCVEFQGIFKGYDPSLDPYSLYLGNMLEKIMQTIVFDYSTDFTKALDKFRRALTFTPGFVFKCSYLHSSELHDQVFDKLL